MTVKIEWLGHASFRLLSGAGTVYIDPWKLKGGAKADIILVTHTHHDHLSEPDIRMLTGPSTVVVGPKDIKGKVPDATVMSPGDTRTIGGLKVEAHRAYNPAKQFHPKANDWLGYVLDFSGYRVYHAGDTDKVPEMAGLKGIDIALLPIGGTYTMDPKEAAEAAAMIRPKKVHPMHWGDIVGARRDAEEFKRLCRCEVEILTPVR